MNNALSSDIFYYCLLPYLNDIDHIRWIQLNKYFNKQYPIKKYYQQYELRKVPTSYRHKLTNIITYHTSNLPINLTSLVIKRITFNQPFDYLPKSLLSLKIISSQFNQPLDNLPYSLTSLEIISQKFNQHQSTTLPFSLKSLIINGRKYELNKYINI